MADDERAAKAARAKALLKSHQAKKKKTPGTTASNLSHLAGSSRGPPSVASQSVLSAPPSEAPVPDDRSEIGAVTDGPPSRLRNGHDTTPVSSPPVPSESKSPTNYAPNSPPATPQHATPPPPRSHAPSPSLNGTAPPPKRPSLLERPSESTANIAALQAAIKDQQETISFLVAEKNQIAAQLQHLEGVEQRSQQSDQLLEEGRQLVESLQGRVAELENEYRDAENRATQLSAREKDLTQRVEQTGRDLEITKRSAGDLKTQLAQQRERVRQLVEQIEQDDRVEQMEKSMKGIQDRAESLEFQLGKVRQAHAKTKAERDQFEEQLNTRTSKESEWQQKYESLQSEHTTVNASLQQLTAEHQKAAAAHTELQSKHSTTQQALKELQQRASQLTSDQQAASRQLTATQTELANANRRVSQAEDSVKALQKENVELMQSLDEMRKKVVELNEDKVELAEQIESLERAVRTRDDTIAALEGSLDQANNQLDDIQHERSQQDRVHQQGKDDFERMIAEHQQGYAALQAELTESQKAVKDLTAERTAARQSHVQLQKEIDRLRHANTAAEKEKATLRLELNDRAKGGDEVSSMLNNTREEVEALRMEVSLKDEELLRTKAQLEEANLRNSTLDPSTTARSPSLNEEMVEAMRQQHALELSAAQSQLRNVETSLFQEQAKTHTLQRRITALEDEVHIAKMQAATVSPQRISSPRPSSLRNVLSPTSDSSRPSGEFKRPRNLGISPRPVVDADLSADIRHKRKISLSMLKARIDSEMSLRVPLATTPNGHTPRMGKLSELEEGSEDEYLKPQFTPGRPQFGDETHVFCCAACSGDLVVL